MKLLVDGLEAAVVDVGIDLGRGDIAVAEKLLDTPQVRPLFQQTCRKTVPESVAAGFFQDTCGSDRSSDCSLEGLLADVMTS